jgi:hypothetical protein
MSGPTDVDPLEQHRCRRHGDPQVLRRDRDRQSGVASLVRPFCEV